MVQPNRVCGGFTPDAWLGSIGASLLRFYDSPCMHGSRHVATSAKKVVMAWTRSTLHGLTMDGEESIEASTTLPPPYPFNSLMELCALGNRGATDTSGWINSLFNGYYNVISRHVFCISTTFTPFPIHRPNSMIIPLSPTDAYMQSYASLLTSW